MTSHYFENELVNLHYYKYGSGHQAMLCFHGYGMHGKQFRLLEPALGEKYTFYGFDLFFHKETKLKDQSLEAVKKGITKTELATIILEFCSTEDIHRFAIVGYSMGTHYAAAIAEELAPLIDQFIVAAPSCLDPGRLIPFFSKNRAGNKILEKLALHEKAIVNMLGLFKLAKLIDSEAYHILHSEVATTELRFNFYACFTYLRFLETNKPRLLQALNEQNIKSIFIFGKKDRSFPPGIGSSFIKKLTNVEVVVLNEGHEMINKNFASQLAHLLL